jgi:alpha-galactosidase
LQVYARPLANGDLAVGLLNRTVQAAKITAKWHDLGISGKYRIRDIWLKKDVGAFGGECEMEVPAHGLAFLRLTREK